MVSAVLVLAAFSSAQGPLAQGCVFDDQNLNGKRDVGEPGIPSVRVSNQRDIVLTDEDGIWRLPYTDETIFFVIKPRNWMTPVDENKLPRFYYIHKPKGSPKQKYAGVSPTGPLPASIDFPLHKQSEAEKFQAIFFGDTQPRDLREVEYIAKDIVSELVGSSAAFGVTLGDIVFDDLSVFMPLVQTVALIGIPWYNVLGNHDQNYDSPDDVHSDETFESIFGPSYYSFDYGPTHFIVLDDVEWGVLNANGQRTYRGGIGPSQLQFIENDLRYVPQDQLVVLTMHIPITSVVDRAALFRLLESRPFSLSVSAHTHYQEHIFLKSEHGWQGAKPHHHVVNVTTCGSWWQGSPDELGIPHTTMRCGAPNGYSIFTFDGRQYSIEFKAARRPGDYQMNLIVPDSMKAADVAGTPVHANVFGGSELSLTQIRFDAGPWQPMEKSPVPDPEYVKMVERDKSLTLPYRPLPAAINSPHLWKATLPTGWKPGVHRVEVKSVDMFGHSYTAVRAIRIDP